VDPRRRGRGRGETDKDRSEEIDLATCLDQGAVAHLRLDADRYPEASRLLAAAALLGSVDIT